MEKHFLADVMSGESEFRAAPWYNPYGDCIVYKLADEAVVANRVDELLTIYNSAVDDRPIGFQIKGVQAIIRKCGLDGLGVHSTGNGREVTGISVVAVLLAAYEDGPRTLGRRMAYATAMECPGGARTIAADELQLAAGV
jgi:hypothetical protein